MYAGKSLLQNEPLKPRRNSVGGSGGGSNVQYQYGNDKSWSKSMAFEENTKPLDVISSSSSPQLSFVVVKNEVDTHDQIKEEISESQDECSSKTSHSLVPISMAAYTDISGEQGSPKFVTAFVTSRGKEENTVNMNKNAGAMSSVLSMTRLRPQTPLASTTSVKVRVPSPSQASSISSSSSGTPSSLRPPGFSQEILRVPSPSLRNSTIMLPVSQAGNDVMAKAVTSVPVTAREPTLEMTSALTNSTMTSASTSDSVTFTSTQARLYKKLLQMYNINPGNAGLGSGSSLSSAPDPASTLASGSTSTPTTPQLTSSTMMTTPNQGVLKSMPAFSSSPKPPSPSPHSPYASISGSSLPGSPHGHSPSNVSMISGNAQYHQQHKQYQTMDEPMNADQQNKQGEKGSISTVYLKGSGGNSGETSSFPPSSTLSSSISSSFSQPLSHVDHHKDISSSSSPLPFTPISSMGQQSISEPQQQTVIIRKHPLQRVSVLPVHQQQHRHQHLHPKHHILAASDNNGNSHQQHPHLNQYYHHHHEPQQHQHHHSLSQHSHQRGAVDEGISVSTSSTVTESIQPPSSTQFDTDVPLNLSSKASSGGVKVIVSNEFSTSQSSLFTPKIIPGSHPIHSSVVTAGTENSNVETAEVSMGFGSTGSNAVASQNTSRSDGLVVTDLPHVTKSVSPKTASMVRSVLVQHHARSSSSRHHSTNNDESSPSSSSSFSPHLQSNKKTTLTSSTATNASIATPSAAALSSSPMPSSSVEVSSNPTGFSISPLTASTPIPSSSSITIQNFVVDANTVTTTTIEPVTASMTATTISDTVSSHMVLPMSTSANPMPVFFVANSSLGFKASAEAPSNIQVDQQQQQPFLLAPRNRITILSAASVASDGGHVDGDDGDGIIMEKIQDSGISSLAIARAQSLPLYSHSSSSVITARPNSSSFHSSHPYSSPRFLHQGHPIDLVSSGCEPDGEESVSLSSSSVEQRDGNYNQPQKQQILSLQRQSQLPSLPAIQGKIVGFSGAILAMPCPTKQKSKSSAGKLSKNEMLTSSASSSSLVKKRGRKSRGGSKQNSHLQKSSAVQSFTSSSKQLSSESISSSSSSSQLLTSTNKITHETDQKLKKFLDRKQAYNTGLPFVDAIFQPMTAKSNLTDTTINTTSAVVVTGASSPTANTTRTSHSTASLENEHDANIKDKGRESSPPSSSELSPVSVSKSSPPDTTIAETVGIFSGSVQHVHITVKSTDDQPQGTIRAKELSRSPTTQSEERQRSHDPKRKYKNSKGKDDEGERDGVGSSGGVGMNDLNHPPTRTSTVVLKLDPGSRQSKPQLRTHLQPKVQPQTKSDPTTITTTSPALPSSLTVPHPTVDNATSCESHPRKKRVSVLLNKADGTTTNVNTFTNATTNTSSVSSISSDDNCDTRKGDLSGESLSVLAAKSSSPTSLTSAGMISEADSSSSVMNENNENASARTGRIVRTSAIGTDRNRQHDPDSDDSNNIHCNSKDASVIKSEIANAIEIHQASSDTSMTVRGGDLVLESKEDIDSDDEEKDLVIDMGSSSNV